MRDPHRAKELAVSLRQQQQHLDVELELPRLESELMREDELNIKRELAVSKARLVVIPESKERLFCRYRIGRLIDHMKGQAQER